jgi:diguanylate cyclase (GGDEF)-like protein/PAS domain S-box-containing protein
MKLLWPLKLACSAKSLSRTRALVTVSGAALLCMAALMAYFLWTSRLRADEAAERSTRNLVEVVESRVSSEFRLVDGLLWHVAEDIRLNGFDWLANEAAAQRHWDELEALLLSFPSITHMHVFDSEGQALVPASPDHPSSIADQDHFQRLRDDPQAVVTFSQALQLRPGGSWSLVMARALRDQFGRFRGVVGAVLDLDQLCKSFNDIDVGRDGLTLMRSTRDSRLVLRVPRRNEQDFNQALAPHNPVRRLIDAGVRAGSLSYTATTDGVNRIASFKRLENHPFYVQVGLSEHEYLAAWRRQAADSAVLAALMMGAFGVVTWRLGRAQRWADAVQRQLRASEQRLKLSEQRMAYVLSATEDGIWDWDIARDRVEHNQRWGDILGQGQVPPSHPVSYYENLIHPDDREAVLAHLREALAGHGPLCSEHRMLRPDGSMVWVLDRGQVVERAPDGTPLRMAGSIADITERKQAEARLALAASVFSHAREGITITDAQARIIEVNQAFTRITGYEREEVLGRNPSFLQSGRHDSGFFEALWGDLLDKGFWEGEIWNRHKSGSVHAEMMTITVVRDGQGRVSQYVALFSDITRAKENEQLLKRFAHFDALTGLPNRVLLADRLGQAMARARRSEQFLALAYVDLDGFKAVNDAHGHEAGDHVLLTVAERMKSCLREHDTIARLGGDEFVAVLADLPEQSGVVTIVERLLATIAQPVRFQGIELHVSGSVGVTFYPQPEKMDADQLLRQADQAMYQAKLAGKNRHHVFDVHRHVSLQGRYEQIELVRQGLRQHEFELHYQPKVNMRSGQVLGLEALIRWRHPERGLLLPGEFLPMIAQHPVEIELGWWVIEAALAQIEAWRSQGLHLPVSVNVTGHHLQQPQFVTGLQQRLRAHAQVPVGQLELEVLESSALDDMALASTVIEQCQHLGVNVALDDFGTGYSTLVFLKRLPAKVLKIDRSFVQDMLHDTDDLTILDGVIGLARAFFRDLVAEGVESVAHGKLLLQLGCEVAQGYAVARPMPGAAVPDWTRSWRPDPEWQRTQRLPSVIKPALYALVDHREWMRRLLAHVSARHGTCPALGSEDCPLARWLTSLEADDSRQAAVAALQVLHARFHAAARELVARRAANPAADDEVGLAEVQRLHRRIEAALLALIDGAVPEPEPESEPALSI